MNLPSVARSLHLTEATFEERFYGRGNPPIAKPFLPRSYSISPFFDFPFTPFLGISSLPNHPSISKDLIPHARLAVQGSPRGSPFRFLPSFLSPPFGSRSVMTARGCRFGAHLSTTAHGRKGASQRLPRGRTAPAQGVSSIRPAGSARSRTWHPPCNHEKDRTENTEGESSHTNQHKPT